MQAIQTFFRTLVKSMISPAYYNHVVRAPYSFSWKYFLGFNLLGALLFGLVVGVPLSLVNVSGMIRQAATVFPADLEIAANRNGISVNQILPYSVALPTQWEEARDQNVPANLVTFVSEEQASVGARVVETYDSFAVITPTTIYVKEDEDTGEVRAYAVPEFDQPFVVDRKLVDTWVNRVADNPFFKNRLYAPVVAVFVVLFSYPFIVLWKTVTLAFYSVLVWVITSITMKNKQLSFGKIFQIGQHSMTLVAVVAVVVNLLSLFTLGGIFYLVAFLIWTLYLISQLQSGAVKAAAVTESVKRVSRTRAPRKTAKRAKKK